MIGELWLCLLFGHDYETGWDEQFEPGLGAWMVEYEQCTRCNRKINTGRSYQVEDQQD